MSLFFTNDTLTEVAQAAKDSPRLRKNFNFHAHNESKSHRLLNALEPGSYVPPHRHLDPEKDETMIVLRGRFGVVLFDERGAITQQAVLAADCALGVTIPVATFHTIFALESGSVFFESKAGPYAPLLETEKASWAPQEGEPDAKAYLDRLVGLFVDSASK